MIRRPPRSTQSRSSAASDVYKRQSIDCHLVLIHRLEQARLGPRRRSIYLVNEHDVCEYRPGLELELPGLLIVDRRAGNVRGEEIRRELDALERSVDRLGNSPRQHGLPDTGHVLYQ